MVDGRLCPAYLWSLVYAFNEAGESKVVLSTPDSHRERINRSRFLTANANASVAVTIIIEAGRQR